ncbi:hypothetical protein HOA55_04825 [archaeon]|nr:hypothetical protein [archaeon]MBT3578104.1 hypothetical protein [archaeon]MBT6820652.1 hypothetical protein [archaeon]MBT6956479.1 hypothetical protein [archaeon]MBT7024938.1 hypothetical protein [archaeon]
MAERITDTTDMSFYGGDAPKKPRGNIDAFFITPESKKEHPIYGVYIGKLLDYEFNGARTYGRVGDVLQGFIEFDQVAIFNPRTNKMEVSDKFPVRVPMLGIPRPINQDTLEAFADAYNHGKAEAESKDQANQQP